MNEAVWRELNDRAFLHGKLPVFRALIERGHSPVVALRAVMTPAMAGAIDSLPPDPRKAAKAEHDKAAALWHTHAIACSRCTLSRPRCEDGTRFLEAENVAWNAYQESKR